MSRAASTIGCRDLKWLREWFADQVCSEWCDGKGNPIHNWGRLLAVDWRYARVDAARRNPDRVPDARRNGDGCDEVVRPSLSEFMRDFERRA